MTFFNRRLLAYAAIVLTATLLMYGLVWKPGLPQWAISLGIFAYIAVIVSSCVLISRRDPYQYFGFNYHFITYIVCLAVPLGLRALNGDAGAAFIRPMALSWGVGVLVHFIIFLVLARKRRLKGYDKGEIFQ